MVATAVLRVVNSQDKVELHVEEDGWWFYIRKRGMLEDGVGPFIPEDINLFAGMCRDCIADALEKKEKG